MTTDIPAATSFTGEAMISCSCDYDPPDFHCATIRKARKPHRCEECGTQIKPGERYEHVAGANDGSIWTAKTCNECWELRQFVKINIPCFCWMYGNMIEDAEICISEAVSYAPDETHGLMFGFLRRLHPIKRRARQRIAA